MHNILSAFQIRRIAWLPLVVGTSLTIGICVPIFFEWLQEPAAKSPFPNRAGAATAELT